MGRLLRHLLMPPWRVRLTLPGRALRAIESAIRESEATHSGEIRFAVEGTLHLRDLLRGQTARDRAVEVFSQLRVWDTEQNNGVLIYLLLADHDVEILADRGAHARIGAQGWEQICREMEACFRRGGFEQGAVQGVRAIGALLSQHYPPSGKDRNEIDDKPVVL